MGKKRGQITLIVILAFVILIIFFMLFAARAAITKKQMQEAATKKVAQYTDQTAIKQYVTSCLTTVSDEVMVQAAMQAGTFNFENLIIQKDYVEYNSTELNRTFNVSIVIFDKYQWCPKLSLFPPEYPVNSSLLSALTSIYRDPANNCINYGRFARYSGFFGYNNYTRLCAWNGSNKPGGFATLSCRVESYNYPSSRTVPTFQERMQEEINKQMMECVNTSFIMERYPANITMENMPETTVTFGERDVTITTTYPFVVEVTGGRPIQKMGNFTVRREIPFKNMYNFVFELIWRDVSEYNFNKFNESSTLSGFERQFIVNRTTLELRNQQGEITIFDVIYVVDNRTILQSRPFIFAYALSNRRPALDYIHVVSSTDFDIGVMENDTLKLKPRGYDPDEDAIVYNYSLWQEDYNETYDFTKPECIGQTDIEIIKNRCMNKDTVYSFPRKLSNSTDFRDTGRDADLYIEKKHTGFHIINISIWDREMLRDYQEVRILVADKPVVCFNSTNFYNFPKNTTSYEDPYIIDGSCSRVGVGTLTVFNWTDESYGEFKSILKYPGSGNPDDKKLIIPNDTALPAIINVNHNIATIGRTNTVADNVVFKQPNKLLNNGQPNPEYFLRIYNISLTTVANTFPGQQAKEIYQVEVKQCLPHRNATIPAYPYNSPNPDNDYWGAFMANHTCCLDDYTYANTNEKCYHQDRWGGWKGFENLWSRGVDSSIYPENMDIGFTNNNGLYKNLARESIGKFGGPLRNRDYENDIYMQTFDRNCSGYRGNICSGNASEIRIIIDECDDANYGTGERCEGPESGESNTISNSEIGCYQYTPGITFESASGRGTGNCADTKCSMPGTDGYISNGKYVCSGWCQDGECNYGGNCKCDSTICGASSQCTDKTGPPLITTVNNPNDCSAGAPGIPDRCNACTVEDETEYCQANKCGAESACDNRKPGVIFVNLGSGKCNELCKFECAPPYRRAGTTAQCINSCTSSADCPGIYQCKDNLGNLITGSQTGTCQQ